MVKDLDGPTKLVIALVICHFIFLMFYFEPAISTPDAQGYFAQAKLIAKEARTYLETGSAVQYVGPHWLGSGGGKYYTTFPPGLPTILAVIYRIFGPKASLLLNPLMASLSLLGLFLICRSWIGERWGLLAAGFMAVNPFANEHALFGDSHTAVIFFLVWGLFFLTRWIRTNSAKWVFLTGLFIGLIPTIRYPEILFLFAFGIFILLYSQRNKGFRRSLIYGLIGALIPIILLLIRNQVAFGAFYKTGYSLSTEQSQFGFNYFLTNAAPYLMKIMGEGCGPIFVLAVIGIVILCSHHDTWRKGILFVLLIAPITMLYMSYYWRVDPQSMRFLLPTFFIYTIAGVWFLRMLYERYRNVIWIGSIVLLLITGAWGLPQSLLKMGRLKQQNGILAQIASVVEDHVEPGSIIIANEGINQHLDFIGRWRLADAAILDRSRNRSSQMFMDRKDPRQRKQRNLEAKRRYQGITGPEILDLFTNDVWDWAGDRQRVFWIMTEGQYDDLKWWLSGQGRLEVVKEIKLPLSNDLHPPMGRQKGFIRRGPAGPDQIFDLQLTGGSLLLVEWLR